MDIYKLKERKKELGYSNKQVAELSGVPLGTVQKIFGGETKAPRRATYLAIKEVLYPERDYSLAIGAVYTREEAFDYEIKRMDKAQGEFTLEDYYALPDEIRVELIDGVIYYMATPSLIHQMIVGEVFNQLWGYADEHEGECLPLISPINVQLDKDNKTIVQPDVIVVCDLELMAKKVLYGAPEFVLEVLSPSTKSKDMLIKLRKYKEAGCKEVWMVDPDKKTIAVYDFRSDTWPDIYNFEDSVPVKISEGRCSVDFTKVEKKIAWMNGNN